MAKRKLKFIEKVIVLSTVLMVILLIGFWLSLKRTNRVYLLPEGFSGWVTIRYNSPDAEALPLTDGAFELRIPDSGYLYTSSPLEKGWGKDTFFWLKASEKEEIPNYIQVEGQTRMFIHGRDIRHFSHEHLLKTLEVGQDTILWDGTEIERKSEREVRYQAGELSLEYFYVFDTPQDIDVPLPPIPNKEALESMQDRRLD